MSAPTSNGSDIPRDAKLIQLILSSMGVEEYEPRVVNQLLEFMYRYVSDVLQDAQVYATHANKNEISLDDIKLAIQSKVNYSFTQPPPRELLVELAQAKNSQPLPLIPPKFGVHIPPDEFCLTASNYQIEKKKAPLKPTDRAGSASAVPSPTTTNANNNTNNNNNTTSSAVPKVLFSLGGFQKKGLPKTQ